MRTSAIKRGFSYNNQNLGDPNPNFSPEQVKEIFAHARPELASAAIEGPEMINGRLIYRLVTRVGTKG